MKENKIFENRKEAAILLCKELEKHIHKRESSVIVIAIPRGGVVLGDIIASFFDIQLDIVISKKIGAPQNPELAIGAVMHDGTFYPNSEIINILNIPQDFIEKQINNKIKETCKVICRLENAPKDFSIIVLMCFLNASVAIFA